MHFSSGTVHSAAFHSHLTFDFFSVSLVGSSSSHSWDTRPWLWPFSFYAVVSSRISSIPSYVTDDSRIYISSPNLSMISNWLFDTFPWMSHRHLTLTFFQTNFFFFFIAFSRPHPFLVSLILITKTSVHLAAQARNLSAMFDSPPCPLTDPLTCPLVSLPTQSKIVRHCTWPEADAG